MYVKWKIGPLRGHLLQTLCAFISQIACAYSCMVLSLEKVPLPALLFREWHALLPGVGEAYVDRMEALAHAFLSPNKLSARACASKSGRDMNCISALRFENRRERSVLTGRKVQTKYVIIVAFLKGCGKLMECSWVAKDAHFDSSDCLAKATIRFHGAVPSGKGGG